MRTYKDNLEVKDDEINLLKNSFEQLKSSSTISIKNLESLLEKKELQLKTTNEKYQLKVDELKAKNSKLQNKFDLLGVEQKNLENTYEQYKNDTYDYKVNSKKEKTELLNETNDLNLKLDKSEVSLNDCKKQLVDAKEAFQKLKVDSDNEIVQLRHRVENLSKDLNMLHATKNKMKVEQARLEENNKSLQNTVLTLENTVNSNKRTITQKEKELDDVKNQFTEQKSQLEMKYQSMERELKSKTKILNESKIESNERALKNDIFVQDMQKESATVRRTFENKITDLQHQLKEKDIYHESMKDSFEKNINEVNIRMKKKEVELNELRKKYDTTHTHHTNLKLRVISQLDKARMQIENSENVKRKALLKYEENEKTKQDTENRYKILKLEMDEVKSKLTRQLKHAKEEEKVLQHELNQSMLSINDMKHRVEAAENSINKYKIVEAKYENVCKDYEESQVEITSLRNQLWNANERGHMVENLKKRLGDLNDDHRKLTEDLTVKSSTIINLEEQLDKNARVYKSKIANYDIETERMTRNMQIKVDDTYDMYNRVVEESAALREQLTQCREEIERLKKSLRQVQLEKDEIISKQSNKIMTLTEVSTNAHDAMKEMQQRMVELQIRLGAARKEATMIKEDSEFKDNEMKGLKRSLMEKTHVNNSLVSQLDGIQDDFKEFLSRSSTLMTPRVHSILNEQDTKRLLELKNRNSRADFRSSTTNISNSRYGFETRQLLETRGLSGVQMRDLNGSRSRQQRSGKYPVVTPYMSPTHNNNNASRISNNTSLTMSELRKEFAVSPSLNANNVSGRSSAMSTMSTSKMMTTTDISNISSTKSLSPSSSINSSPTISKRNKKMRRFSDVRGIFNTAVKLKLAKDLKDVFRVLDKDHTGTLDIQELKAGLEKMRIKMDDVELKQLWVALDLDGDDKISYDDFERFCQKKSLASQVAIVAKGRSTDDADGE